MGDWHELHSGLLTDMPGRHESWIEEVRYDGESRWTLRLCGTDFSGLRISEKHLERMGSKKLIKWALARDTEDAETRPTAPSRFIGGERVARLLIIAKEEKATYCENVLMKYLSDKWLPSPRAPVIVEIIGVELRGVWIGVKHAVYSAKTTEGKAYLYPPDDKGLVRIVLHGASISEKGHFVKASEKIRAEMDRLRSSFEGLSAHKK